MMEKTINRIAVIIPIHNRLNITKEGLKYLDDSIAFYKKEGTGNTFYNLVVVDDGSTDGSSEWITAHYPEIKILMGDGNLWWSGGINMGARYAIEELNADYILLWNDDTVCEDRYFFELAKILDEAPVDRMAILVSKILWLHNPDILFNFGCFYSRKTGKSILNGSNEKDGERFSEITPVDWSGGMGTLIPAKVCIAVNYFDDENFPQYHGDMDFFLRAQEKGYKAYAVPTLKIWNNAETTGLNRVTKLKDVVKLLSSNRSMYNFKQNYQLDYRHSKTLNGAIVFSLKYLMFTLRSFKHIVWK